MDINAYYYFIALERYKTITATARKLYLSQPALTNYIKRIEKEFNVPLIVRGTSPVKFTEYGEIYLKYAKEITDLDKRLAEDIELRRNQAQDMIRVSVNAVGIKELVKYLPKFQKANPDIHVEIAEYYTGKCEELLLSQGVDFAFISGPVTSDEIEYIPCLWTPCLFVIPRIFFSETSYDLTGNSMTSPTAVDLDFLENKPFIVTSEETGTTRYLNSFLAEHHICPAARVNVNLLATGTSLCRSGYGIILLNQNGGSILQLAGDSNVVFCTIDGIDTGRWAIMARKKLKEYPEAADRFWTQVKEQIRNQPF